ncbi:MAG TPA: hypothetical protein VK498_05805 [Ferruginibacter sp.]|nr:hypothetical protein [Ferruginibacter sp.]
MPPEQIRDQLVLKNKENPEDSGSYSPLFGKSVITGCFEKFTAKLFAIYYEGAPGRMW